MKTKELIVNSKNGIHLRVAGEIVKLAKSHDCKLSLSCNGCPRANACSIMQLLTLDAAKGSKLEASAEGPDAELVIEKLSDLLSDGAGI
ncbi:MAG: HPr family phosphocarrier protein [bacterium]|jgi:phosphotransferase system HPr (HPr) family protein